MAHSSSTSPAAVSAVRMIAAVLIITARRIAVRDGQVTRARKARLFPG
jgi:hypothetical protein